MLQSSSRAIGPTANAIVGVCAIAALVGVVAAGSPPLDGYVVTQRISSSHPSLDGTIRIMIAEGRVRLEFSGTRQSPSGGVHILLRDDGRMSVLMPRERKVIILDGASAARSAQTAAIRAPTVQFSNISTNMQDLGRGERLLDYDTHRYRVTQKYTVNVGLGGQTTHTQQEVTADIWTASDIPALDAGFDRFTSAFSALIAGGADGSAKPLADALQGKAAPGFPLKTVITTTITPVGGTSVKTVTTTEVTGITRKALAESDFEVPRGYEVVDVAQILGGLRRSADTAYVPK